LQNSAVPEPEPINPILERIHIPNEDEIAKQRRDEAKSKQEEEQYANSVTFPRGNTRK